MRILEPEVMMSEAEVVAYDQLVKKYLAILHAGFVETVLNLSPPKGNFLDVGTGTGWIAIGVAKHNPNVEVTGVDLSDTMLKVAEHNARAEGVADRVRFIKGDAKQLPFENQSFDAVFSHNMMHHLPEPHQLLTEMARAAKSEGAIILRDLKRHSRFVTEMHVQLFGLTYNRMMKKEYRDSILAALSEKEWQELFQHAKIKEGKLTKQFVTHMGIERAAQTRNSSPTTIPTPWFMRLAKCFYVSKTN